MPTGVMSCPVAALGKSPWMSDPKVPSGLCTREFSLTSACASRPKRRLSWLLAEQTPPRTRSFRPRGPDSQPGRGEHQGRAVVDGDARKLPDASFGPHADAAGDHRLPRL